MKLERTHMLDVEGGTRQGDDQDPASRVRPPIDNAYGLAATRAATDLRRSHATLSEHYRPNPASRRYVHHLRLYYAQSHPAEDFAETLR